MLADLNEGFARGALSPDHAAQRQALVRGHEQLRRSGLGVGCFPAIATRKPARSPGQRWPPMPDSVFRLWRRSFG